MILHPVSYILQWCDVETPLLSNKKENADVASGGEFESKDCINSTIEIARSLLLHLKLDNAEAAGVMDNSAWDVVGDLLQLETTWGNSNVIKSDDGM
jgi:hypothetical protein